MTHPTAIAALAIAALAIVTLTAGCTVDCHESEVAFDAQLPPLTATGAVVLRNVNEGIDRTTGDRWAPVRIEGVAELTLTLRGSAPIALHACSDDPTADGKGDRLVEGDARGATTLPFADCFWLQPAEVAAAPLWTVQAGVSSELVYVFGEEKSVDPRDGCPPGPTAADFAWELVPATSRRTNR